MNEQKLFSPENGPKISKLNDVMDPSREISRSYRYLIDSQAERSKALLLNRFSRHLNPEMWEKHPRARDFVKSIITNDILIDIGGGYETDPQLAQYFNANIYINVDSNLDIDSAEDNELLDPLTPLNETEADKLHLIEVRADMLDFVARMRDNSANFVINGIDEFVIMNDEYNQALVQELIRATKPGGIIFGTSSRAHHILNKMGENCPLKPKHLDINEGLNLIGGLNDPISNFIYQKDGHN